MTAVDIQTQLALIDQKKIRCMSDNVLGNENSMIVNGVKMTAAAYLAQLEAQQVTLRAQLAALGT
jgi:hypothetical protein